MATNAATNMSLREVRGLAQKLWGQCGCSSLPYNCSILADQLAGRDSDSLYRGLAPDVKRTRNLLEDLEEQYADDDDIPLRVLERLHKCQASLHRLELTLKAYHTSTHKWQDVKPMAVQELKEGVCGATQELKTAFEGNGTAGEEEPAIGGRKTSLESTAGIPTNVSQTAGDATTPNYKAPTIPPRAKRTQHPPSLTSTTASDEPASSSTPSSALTAHDSVTGFTCSPPVSNINRTPSEEKQVVAGPWTGQQDWRMLCGDPLSVDIEEASKWITGSWRGSLDEADVVDGETEGAAADICAREPLEAAEEVHDANVPHDSTTAREGLGITGDSRLDAVRTPGFKPSGTQTQALPDIGTVDILHVEQAASTRAEGDNESKKEYTMALHERRPSQEGSTVAPSTTSASAPAVHVHAAAMEQSQILTTFRAELEKRFASQNADQEAVENDWTTQTSITGGLDVGGTNQSDVVADESNKPSDAEHESSIARKEPECTDSQHNVHTETLSDYRDANSCTPIVQHEHASDSALPSEDSNATTTDVADLTSRPAPATPPQEIDAPASPPPPTGAPPRPAAPSQATDAPACPPPPTRAPPPPPPRSKYVKKPECVKKRPPPPPPPTSPSKARYRVVNTSPPPIQQSDIGEEEDLYTTSRPTSSKASPQPMPIPQVKVTECETGEDRPRSIVMLTSLEPDPTGRRASTSGITHVAFCVAPEVDHGARLRSRKSVDETFKIENLAPLHEVPAAVQRSRSVSAPERSATIVTHRPSRPDLRASPKVSVETERPETEQPVRVLEYYGNPTVPIDMTLEECDLDGERIERICQCWNSQLWDSADAYLMGHLESLVETNRFAAARRVRHLLGVCASFRGQWERALGLFISVLRTPIKSIEDLDAGDCAAAYWLGDAYAMMNRRTEALLAYCIAEQHHLTHDAAAASLRQCLTSDQQAVQLGLSKADFKVRWAQEALNGHDADGDTILHPSIITQEAARACLNSKQSRFQKRPSDAYTDGSRAGLLFSLDKSTMDFKHYRRMNLTHQAFMVPYLWPMPYDPMFAMENVSRGRLIAYECDLLEVFRTNPEAKVPRNGPLGLGRMDCFTCSDLEWLIISVRECLRTLEMEWSEVANVEGVWFLARYHTMRDRIATTDYFSIAIFQQSLRSGYGVEVCPDGISSARLIKCTYEYKRGVEWKAEKRTREYIKRFLDKAYKQRAARGESTSRRDSMQGKPLLAGSGPRTLHRARTAAMPIATTTEMPPPIPPRPSTTRPPD